jgi:hypothetical protein
MWTRPEMSREDSGIDPIRTFLMHEIMESNDEEKA